MKQPRRAHESSDFSDEDRHAHKYSKHRDHHREKLLTDEMGSHRRSPADDRIAHRHSKQRRSSHDKHATDKMARSRHSHQHTDNLDSDSSDEILIKGRASRRFRREDEKDLARQQKRIEKARRGGLRPSSSSSEEIYVHYVPVITKSVSPPLTDSRQSQSRSPSSPKSGGFSASEITNQLKGITMSWLGRRSDDPHKSSRQSHSRSKHEKRDKHGKRRVSDSKFLAPLAQRWVCYKCGKLRSDTIEQRHPLKEGQKMQPNWCGKCRVHGELHGRTLVHDGKRHYCWGCGIVRSKTYHSDNPIGEDEMSTPNYCQPCRQMSPAFDYNLREASEVGSVASVRDKAFSRQMHDAELSDVDEEDDDQSTYAPGKENQNPKSEKKLKASKSFMLENCSYGVKTTSDDSSEGDVPISILKAIHLQEERARSTSGGCRLSDGSYQPPSVESALSENFEPGLKTADVTEEVLSTFDGGDDQEMKNYGMPARDEEPSRPTIILAPNKRDSGDSFNKKKVHWDKQAASTTTADSNASDSAYCSGYPSELSYKSAGSRRSRRDPGVVSSGSPPIPQGESNVGDLRHDVRKPSQASLRRPESRGKGFGKDLPTNGTFGEPAHNVDADTFAYRRDSTQSSHSNSIPPTPPESFVNATTEYMNHTGRGVHESPITRWVDSPEIPNFSRPYLSPAKKHSDVSPNFSRPYLSPPKQRAKVAHDHPEPISSSGFGARPGYMEEYSPYRSTAHFSDSTQRRNYSGYGAPGEDYAAFPQYERHGPTAQHDDWPPPSWPADNDYSAFPEEGDDDNNSGFFSSDGGSDSLPASTGHSAFDFSGLGDSSPFNAASGDGFAPEGEKFVRRKKTTTTTTHEDTPRQHSWCLYDDGDDDDGSAPKAEDCHWRRDGRTTVHRSRGGKEASEGKTVQILSIREMGSDEDLTIGEDIDEASELGTVVGDDSMMMKSICAA